LLLVSALVLAGFVGFTGLALERAVYKRAEQAERDKLQGLVYGLLGATNVDEEGRATVIEQELPDPLLKRPHSGLYAWITAANGKTLWGAPSLLNAFPPQDPPRVGEWFFQRGGGPANETFFFLTFGIRWTAEDQQRRRYTVHVARDTTDFERQLQGFRTNLWGWLVVSAVLLLGVQLLVLHWGIAPLSKVARELRDIEAGAKNRIERQYPRELAPLTLGLNTLLIHEHNQQMRYRNALDDLAHSLKTPLAVLRGIADDPAIPAAERQRLAEHVGRMDQVVGYQLHKAATAGRQALTTPLALRPLVDKLIRAMQKVYAAKSILYRLDVDEALQVRADEGDLMELLGNLLENAAKFCRQKIEVAARRRSGLLELSVEDDGPGFPQDAMEYLVQRGVRADSRTEGQGIGLAVVRDIVNAYGGEMRFEVAAIGGGRVVITLPMG
jgi:two-component system sensor histidine kinase PhoQ